MILSLYFLDSNATLTFFRSFLSWDSDSFYFLPSFFHFIFFDSLSCFASLFFFHDSASGFTSFLFLSLVLYVSLTSILSLFLLDSDSFFSRFLFWSLVHSLPLKCFSLPFKDFGYAFLTWLPSLGTSPALFPVSVSPFPLFQAPCNNKKSPRNLARI